MKKLLSKSTTKKILIVILIVILFNFIVPNYSHADFGGVLFDPIIDLVAAIGDAVLAALQYFMYDGNVSLSGQNIFSVTVPYTVFYPSAYELDPDPGATVNYQVYADSLAEPGWWENLQSWAYGTNSWWLSFSWVSDSFDWMGNIFGQEDFSQAMLWASEYGKVMAQATYGIPVVRYSPEEIFSNEVPALDINFITPRQWEGDTQEQTDAMNERSVTQALHEVVASWYVVLRNLAIVILLSVLLYVGIRMVISSTAGDKAKYKQMLMDWLVALCILFFLHYVMSFILTLVDTLVDGISGANQDIVVGIYTDSTSGTLVQSSSIPDPENPGQNLMEGEPLLYKTDLTGICRLFVQSKDLSSKLVYLILYLALVIYTVMFTWIYVKRAITVAFLTLMAPLIAITYPIDRIKDGQAQAFNIWLREFVFNALLQPFHLILYTIFLGSSIEIATKNPIYAILFLAFIIPSEKLLRRMFGFDNSETAGSIGSAAKLFGGAAVLRSAGNLVGKIGNRRGGRNGKGDNGNDGAGKKQLRTKNTVTDPNGPSLTSAFGNRRGSVANRNTRSVGAGTQNRGTNSGRNQPGLSQQTQRRQRTMATGNRRGLTLGNNPGANGPKTYRVKRTSGANNTHALAAQIAASPQRPTRASHPIRGALGTAGHILGGTVKTVGRVAGKAALTGIGAGIGATVGIAAGITGDDLEDVLTMGATGTSLGAIAMPALGTSVARGASNLATDRIPGAVRGIRDTYERAAYDPVDLALKQQARELMADQDYKLQISQSLESNLGRKPSSAEVKSAMQTGTEYYNSGITETKDIVKAMKTEQNIKKDIKKDIKEDIKVQLINQGIEEKQAEQQAETRAEQQASRQAREQAKVVSKMANKISDEDLRDKEKSKTIRKSLQRELLSKVDMDSMTDEQKAQAKEEAKVQAKNVMKLIKKHKGIY